MSEFQYVKQEKEKWRKSALEQAAENNRLKGDLKFYKGMSIYFSVLVILYLVLEVVGWFYG